MELKAERVKQLNCGQCGAAVEVSKSKPLGAIACPQCHKKMVVPASFGDFMLVGFLGRGATSIVCKAFDEKLGRQVAIKILSDEEQDKGVVEATQREARTLASINDPHIVAIYSIGSFRDQPYIVMELLGGGTAEKALSSGPLEEARAIDIAGSVARGLAAAQKMGLVHMDVKPGNILLDRAGNAKLIDFGIAQHTRKTNDQVVGTPFYVAPEVVRGKSVDFKADMYSLGATLFHLLAGRPPFEGDNPTKVITARLNQPAPALSDVRDGLRPQTVAVVDTMLQRDPSDRFASYDDLLAALAEAHDAAARPVEESPMDALAALAGGTSTPAPRRPAAPPSPEPSATDLPAATPVTKAAPPAKKKSLMPVFIAAALVIVIGGGTLYKMLSDAKREPAPTADAPKPEAAAPADASGSPTPATPETPAVPAATVAALTPAPAADAAPVDPAPAEPAAQPAPAPAMKPASLTPAEPPAVAAATPTPTEPTTPEPPAPPAPATPTEPHAETPAAPAATAAAPAKAPAFKSIYNYSFPLADKKIWHVLDIVDAKSAAGATMTKATDGSISVTGPESDNDVYTITVKTRMKKITGLRLDAVADPSLPGSGPGRQGDFVLGKFAVNATGSGGETPLSFVMPKADVAGENYSAQDTLDEDPATGWALGEANMGKTHYMTVNCAEPVGDQAETVLTFTLAFHGKYALGKFLLSATTSSKPDTLKGTPYRMLPTYLSQLVSMPPTEMLSEHGATLTKQPDNSVLAGGKNTPSDTYTVSYTTAMYGLTGLQLELLPDPSLPKDGPGRLANGITIAEITVEIAPRNDPTKKEPVKFESVAADFNKKGNEIDKAVDGNANTFWTSGDKDGEKRYIGFTCAAPIGATAGSIITFTIQQKLNIGRFRVLATAVKDKPTLAKILVPPPVEDPSTKPVILSYTFGGKSKDAQGHDWVTVADYKPKGAGAVGGTRSTAKLKDAVFTGYWSNPEGFKATVPRGIYEVKLIFIEPSEKPPVRGFDVWIEGKQMPKSFILDINREAGGAGKPLIRSFGPFAVADGILDIELKGKGRVLSAVQITGKPVPVAPAKK